jgi:hypothetical protein
MSKLGVAIAFGAGYVLGARAGRERYDQITAKADAFWHDPRVQRRASQAQDLAAEKATQAAGVVAAKTADAASSAQAAVTEAVTGAVKERLSRDEASDPPGTAAGDPIAGVTSSADEALGPR